MNVKSKITYDSPEKTAYSTLNTARKSPAKDTQWWLYYNNFIFFKLVYKNHSPRVFS